MTDFFNLLKEEWIYHLSNLGILLLFSVYGAYTTISKRIKLQIFRLTEKDNKKITDAEKNSIKYEERQGFMREFLKAFLAFFILYTIYVIYRTGIYS